MTRINAGISVNKLSDKHLIAEHREIKRIPNAISKGKFNMKGQPDKFILGIGHVKFFYDKCGYLFSRYSSLYQECLKRGFNVTYFGSAWDNVPKEMMGDYVVTKEAYHLIEERIKEKQNNK